MEFLLKDSQVVLKPQSLKGLSISPSLSSFHHNRSLDVVFGSACDVAWSHKAICRIISRGTPRPNCTQREWQSPFKCCHKSVNLCCSVIHSTVFHTHWLNFTGLSGDAGVYLVNWSSTAGNCYCCFSGMDSVYAFVRSHTFLQSIFPSWC